MKINKKGDRKMGFLTGEFALQNLLLLITIATLAAIVYCLRVLVLMERRIARIEMHVERAVDKVMKEEIKIEKAIRKRKK